MNPAFVILSVLFFTSAIMCASMTLAWVHFGRKRYVLTWAVSYGFSVLQWMLNSAGIALGMMPVVGLAGLCILASSTLVALGARQRVRQPIRPGLLLVTLLVVGAAVILSYSPWGTAQARMMIPSGYAGIMTAVAAAALWPNGRRFTATEGFFFVTLVLFTLFQLALSASGFFAQPDGRGLESYRALLGIGLPAIYVATGVAAVLVIAGDLAGQLGTMVSHDPLTGILNRRGTEEAATKAIANAQRHKRVLAAVICDMDGFKALNDSYGHVAGDAALRAFAGALSCAVRQGDVVGRIGGDEFCVLLLDSSGDAAAEVMERVRGGLSALAVRYLPGGSVQASFGVAELRPGDQRLDDLIIRADRALYESKQQGRDRVTLWSEAAAA